MKSELRRLGVLALLVLVLSGCPNKAAQTNVPTPPAGVPESAQHAAEAQHWFEEYFSGVNSSGQTLSFQQKYDAAFLAFGMASAVDTAYARLRQSLSSSELAEMQIWSFTEGSCSTTGPRLLLVKQAAIGQAGGHLCIASLLLTSLFLKNATPGLISFHDRLVEWGIDPRTFTGQYPQQLTYKGVTQDDWYAVLGAYGGAYDSYFGSLYFVLAYQIQRVLLPNAPPDDLDKAAYALVTKANGACDVSTLSKVLQDAFTHAEQDIWGFDAPGDGRDEITRLWTNFGQH
jgi:hypothetical protein